jgi:hypothetical protein
MDLSFHITCIEQFSLATDELIGIQQKSFYRNIAVSAGRFEPTVLSCGPGYDGGRRLQSATTPQKAFPVIVFTYHKTHLPLPLQVSRR